MRSKSENKVDLLLVLLSLYYLHVFPNSEHIQFNVVVLLLTLYFYILTFKSSHLEMFCKKGGSLTFRKFTWKHLCWSFFFKKVAVWKPATLLKRRIRNRCFLVNFGKLLHEHLFYTTPLDDSLLACNCNCLLDYCCPL